MDDAAVARYSRILEERKAASAHHEAVVRRVKAILAVSTGILRAHRQRLGELFLINLIRVKLADGRLPLKRPDVVVGGPAIGGRCDACDCDLAPRQLVVEIQTGTGRPVSFHADCFMLWEELRRQAV